MTSVDKKKAARGPESGFWDTLKGQDVVIDTNGHRSSAGEMDTPLKAKLLWVDRYTIGVRISGTGKERMLNKKFIRGIERDDDAAGRAA